MNSKLDSATLRGLICKQYKNISAFAQKNGIQRSTIERIVNAKALPAYDTIAKCQEALGLSAEETGRVFFGNVLRNE